MDKVYGIIGQSMVRRGVIFAMVLSFLYAGAEVRADQFFDNAIDAIEDTLVQPPQSYGFVVTDTYKLSVNSALEKLGEIKEEWSFYTSDGKVYFEHDRFDTPADQDPYSKHIVIVPDDGGQQLTVDSIRGKNVFSDNAKQTSFVVGAVEIYTDYLDVDKRSRRPDWQPIQILTNPCFAQLGLTPIQLRDLPVTQLPDEGESRVYEIRIAENGALRLLRLFFSPSHGDSLVKSEYGVVADDTGSEPVFSMREVRSVDAWQMLPNGRHVPAVFRFVQEQHGQPIVSLTRIISNPVIGSVDPMTFDEARLPEFKVGIDRRRDVSPAGREKMREERQASLNARLANREQSIKDSPKNWFPMLLVVNVIGIVLFVVAFVLYRHFKRSRS